MADNKNNVSQQPQLCKQGCGFYGNPNFDGMCSKCYKDYVQRKANASGVMGRASPSMNTSSERASSLSAAFANAVSSSAPSGLTVDEMRALINPETTSNDSRVHSASVSVDTDAVRSNTTLADVASGAASTGDIDKATGAAGGEKPLNASDGAQASAVKPLNRCAQCQKKVGLTGFTCRCGGTYCADHRYSDRHACQFDYKQRGAEELRKLNPVVVAEKLHKI